MGEKWYLEIGRNREIGTGRGDWYRFSIWIFSLPKKVYLLCLNVTGYRMNFIKSVKDKEWISL